MANRDVFPTENWQWPVTEAERVTERLGETIGQLRRDRDELAAALEGVLFHHQPECLCALDFVCAACSAKATLARIKAGR